MNCKLFLLFAVVLCVGQGNAAPWFGDKIGQWGQNIKNQAQQAGSDMVDKVSNAANSVQDSIRNAGSSLKDKVDRTRQDVEDAVKSSIEKARTEIEAAAGSLGGEISSLTDSVMAKMDPQSIVDEASKVSDMIETMASDVRSKVEDAVETAKTGTMDSTNSWGETIEVAVAKAQELGVDVSECSVDNVQTLATDTMKNAVRCVTDKYKEAKGLIDQYVAMGKEGRQLVEDIKAARDECSKTTSMDTLVCVGEKMVPLLRRLIALGTNAVQTSTKAVVLVQTLEASLTTCISGVAAVGATKVPALTLNTTQCIIEKIQQQNAAAAA